MAETLSFPGGHEKSQLLFDYLGSETSIDDKYIIGAWKHEDACCKVVYVDRSPVEHGPILKVRHVTIQFEQSGVARDSFVEAFKFRFDQDHVPPTTQKGSPNVHVVVSTRSGACKAEEFYDKTLQPFLAELHLQEQIHYTVHQTKSVASITELTKSTFLPRANAGYAQRIILLSGDGGIVDILNGLMSEPHTSIYTQPDISLIPMGTANALAHSSKITADNTHGLAALARGSAQHLPLLKATFSKGAGIVVDEGRKIEPLTMFDSGGQPVLYGAVVCSWGLHAGLVADSDTAEFREFGIDRFKMAVREALYPADGSATHHYKGRVVLSRKVEVEIISEEVARTEHSYVLATLVSNLEETFTISPASAPFDGRMRVIQIGPVDGPEFERIMGLAYQGGKHVKDPALGYEQDVELVHIAFEEQDRKWTRICVDGKIVSVEPNGWAAFGKENQPVLRLVALNAAD